ncbi:hypothetical protein FHX49_002379 [Microbacterium endophyticum]|uniref:DUF262 domain-containing protein n=1 Tax=Microbacterium endophyticum TaxID=1526412 RepID=A0A7W4YN25_9MICO|nr:DUF262 domain-containing protein [Microbacterium endophyticum]MBB2976793.1 hypothetical protein [Microbacterium endophyticum]NIK36570.1 hypothetical protein [Microbacterium endophyticum]
MGTATNVDATAVNTIDWLSTPGATIVVPVYQRQYRWDIGGCEQLLADVRAVADSDESHTHFIGSILSTRASTADAADLVLIDGQQRITTLMLLVAAVHHAVRDSDPDMAAELARVLLADPSHATTKLRPHKAWADVFQSVVLDRRTPGDQERSSRFDDNYAFFRSQVGTSEAPHIWCGLKKLEHVSIALGADANAQQTFESLNSTGEPLRDHELIHNYVLMGLTHAEQTEIEELFWVPIEQNTGESIGSFWQHYLIMTTGREVAIAGERGVYDAFRTSFPRLTIATLREHATQWLSYSEAYRTLLDPTQAEEADLSAHLTFINTFGRGMYPLVMRVYREYLDGLLTMSEAIETVEYVQALLLRRAIVGISNERLVARLCRARHDGPDALRHAIARITPSDERVKVALKYSELPHARYVLGRLAGATDVSECDVEYIFPLAPGDNWSGDGNREWAEYTDDEQNSHRALAPTLGNLTLLEESLAERAFDKSFQEKRPIYGESELLLTSDLASDKSWGTAAIAARTTRLTEIFLHVWARPVTAGIDDDDLTPILDAKRRRGWPRGWEREFDYVEYRGEHWEVHDVKYLFHRIFTRLWADSRADVVAFSADRGGPIFDAQAWNGEWDALDESHFLYMGWDSKYMLTAVQGLLDDAGFAPEVFVKYSYIGAVM